MDEKSRLCLDLAEKLERLRWRLEQPEHFIVEHFASIINEIDLDTERLIDGLKTGIIAESVEIDQDKANWIRRKFIKFLDNMKASLFEKLQTAPASSAVESLNDLAKRTEEFSATIADLIQMEEAYLKLALDIIEATNEAERRLLDNQTFAYLRWNVKLKGNKMGNLVYLSEDYLNSNELSCLKRTDDPKMAFFNEIIQLSLNASLAVGVSRPFILTRSFLIISQILKHLKSIRILTGKVICLESGSKVKLHFMSKDSLFFCRFKINLSQIMWDLFDHSFDTVSLSNMSDDILVSEEFLCNMSGNRLRRFEIADSLIKIVDQINLSENQLEALDFEQLAKAAKLRYLRLINAFLPDVRFSLGFLESLVYLKILQLTLPDASIDFGVFQNLKQLEFLELRSASSLDCSIERLCLTRKHLEQLSVLRLSKLALSHFKIDSIDQDTFIKFTTLVSVCLNNNEIAHIQRGAFENCFEPSRNIFVQLRQNSIAVLDALMILNLWRCENFDLSFNRIEQIPHDLFARMVYLQELCLNNNSIRHITRDAFSNLQNLVVLELDNNMIESIDPHSFEQSLKISKLSLTNNKLKIIDNETFSRLCSLEDLLVKGNQLEKVDLNCFSNLKQLAFLDLSNNQICELNDEINQGVLSELTKLDLSNNQLTRISRHAFSESTKLRTMKLSGNKLTTFDESFFEPFVSLRHLELQDNNLSIDITASTFSSCSFITEINLLGNPSVRVRDDAFSELKSLDFIRLEFREENSSSIKRFLELEENRSFFSGLKKISFVNSSIESFDAFKLDDRFSKLEELDLRGNRIMSMSRECLSRMPRLTHLNVAENMIENLDDATLFHDVRNLRNLNLKGNKLKHIHQQLFKCLSKLEALDLSNNQSILNLNAGLFRGLFSLKRFSLEGNKIVSFDLATLFRACRVLESIDLSNNQLNDESINETSMSGSTAQSLKQLMLANNRLVKMEFVRHLYRLKKLDLSGNMINTVTSNSVNLLCRLVKLNHVNLSNNQINPLDIKAGPNVSVEQIDLSEI